MTAMLLDYAILQFVKKTFWSDHFRKIHELMNKYGFEKKLDLDLSFLVIPSKIPDAVSWKKYLIVEISF